MKVFKETGTAGVNCSLLGVNFGGGGGHHQGKSFGPAMKDGEEVHDLHIFSKNNMSISFCDND